MSNRPIQKQQYNTPQYPSSHSRLTNIILIIQCCYGNIVLNPSIRICLILLSMVVLTIYPEFVIVWAVIVNIKLRRFSSKPTVNLQD